MARPASAVPSSINVAGSGTMTGLFAEKLPPIDAVKSLIELFRTLTSGVTFVRESEIFRATDKLGITLEVKVTVSGG